MHKSIIVFLALLVILLPIGASLNIISKANALNMIPSMYNNDKQDYLQRYEKFYEDDKFREDYYNYHKQHHQQIENKEQLRSNQEPQQHHQHHHKQIDTEKQQNIIQKLQQQQNSMIEPSTQPGNLKASNTHTTGLEPTLTSPPIIAQETGDLSALEKITKLKQQWLELLP